MKFYKPIILILIVFLKTGNLLSENNLFNVNNIQIEKKVKTSNIDLANKAIKKGFDQLIDKILLKEDKNKLSDLNFSSIKKLVTYYHISNTQNKNSTENLVNFNVSFDKNKIHDLFYKRAISYSEIGDKELYILPVLIKDNKISIFNNNYFYENWNAVSNKDLITFELILENIEIIQGVYKNKDNLIKVNIDSLFKEYPGKNIAIIFIEDNNEIVKKIYFKARIQGKRISKSLELKKNNTTQNEFYEKIINDSKYEIIDLIKKENLIDIRTPSFLNVKLNLNKQNNLVKLNLVIKNIDLIENVFVQEFNKDHMKLRIKYLGKLEKIIRQLKNNNINLELISDQWVIKSS